MADRAWKVFERQVAKRLHGKRWLERGDGTPDVDHPLLSPECKYTESTLGKKYIRGLLTKAIDQAKRNAIPGKPWAVFLKQKGMNIEDTLVVMDMRGYAQLIDMLKGTEEYHWYTDEDWAGMRESADSPLGQTLRKFYLPALIDQMNRAPLWVPKENSDTRD